MQLRGEVERLVTSVQQLEAEREGLWRELDADAAVVEGLASRVMSEQNKTQHSVDEAVRRVIQRRYQFLKKNEASSVASRVSTPRVFSKV